MNLGNIGNHGDNAVESFLDWINKRYPGAKARIIRLAKQDRSLNGLGFGQMTPMQFPGASIPALPTNQPDEKPWYEKIADAATKVVPAYFQYKTQSKITDAQIKRMEQGLPPADVSAYAAPPIRIEHQVDPSTVKQALTVSPDTQKNLMIGAAIIAGLFFITQMGR